MSSLDRPALTEAERRTLAAIYAYIIQCNEKTKPPGPGAAKATRKEIQAMTDEIFICPELLPQTRMKENLEPVCLKGTTFRFDEKGNGEVEDTGVTNETGAHQVRLKESPSLSLGEYDDDDGGGDGLNDEGSPACL